MVPSICHWSAEFSHDLGQGNLERLHIPLSRNSQEILEASLDFGIDPLKCCGGSDLCPNLGVLLPVLGLVLVGWLGLVLVEWLGLDPREWLGSNPRV